MLFPWFLLWCLPSWSLESLASSLSRISQRLSSPRIVLTLTITGPHGDWAQVGLLTPRKLDACLWDFTNVTCQVLSWSFLILHVFSNCFLYHLLAHPLISLGSSSVSRPLFVHPFSFSLTARFLQKSQSLFS